MRVSAPNRNAKASATDATAIEDPTFFNKRQNKKGKRKEKKKRKEEGGTFCRVFPIRSSVDRLLSVRSKWLTRMKTLSTPIASTKNGITSEMMRVALTPKRLQTHRDDEAEDHHGHSAETQQEPSMYKEEISYRQEPTQRETHIQKHDGVTQDHRGDIRYAFPG